MLMGAPAEQRVPWFRGVVAVLLFSLVGAWLAVLALHEQRLAERQVLRQKVLSRASNVLAEHSTHSAVVGAVALMGLNEPLLKAVALGVRAPDAPAALGALAAARERFGLDGAYVINAHGIVVAHQTAGASSTGLDVGFRPYFQQAMRGQIGIYAAIGSKTNTRGLYIAAPLYAGSTVQTPILGAVMFKLPFAVVDAALAGTGLTALLLSPQGVVMASSRPEWLYALTPPLTQSRIDAIARLGQLGHYFDNGVASELPFSLGLSKVLIDGVPQAVEHQEMDWGDPGGPWSMVVLEDISQVMPWPVRLRYGGMAFVFLALLGLLVLELLRNRARIAATQQRLFVLGAALENSPLGVVVTDAQGVIEWVNPEFERNTGYCLDEVRGHKPSLLASGKTPMQTFNGMWAAVMTGHAWKGHFINRRKDGTEYHEEATLSPVRNARGVCVGMVGLHQEVSQRMREQEKLRRSERRLKELLEQQNAIFDNAPPVLLTCDGAMHLFNPAFVALLGGTPEQLQDQRVSILFGSPEQHAAFAAYVAPQLAQGLPVRENWAVQRLDGRVIDVRMSGRAVHLDGYPNAALWVIEDVTEVHRAERTMRETSERLELVQEAGKTAVFDVDLRIGRCLWREKIEGVEGIAERVFDDWRAIWLDRLWPADSAAAMARIDAALQGDTCSFHDAWRLQRLEEGVRWYACTAHIQRDGEGKAERIVGVIVDIDAYKKLEEQVAAQVQFQQVLMDTIPVPIFYKDDQGRYLGFNRAYEQAFGIRREDFLGRTVQSLVYLSQDARDRFEADAQAALQGGTAVHREIVMPQADGQPHHMLFWLQGFRRPDGAPGGVIGVFVDISDRERVQRELRHAKELAEEATALKSNFLANMSHEIRTPMNAIIGMSHLALRSGLNQRQHDYVSKIGQASQHLMGVINDILDFSRIEAGKLRIEAQPFVLDQVLGGVVDVVSHKASAQGLELICDVAPDVPPNLVGDALRIGQILINYTNNAIKFTERGEVDIVVRVQQQQGEQVLLRFEVRDTGIGLAPEQIERLFQSFQQADTSTTRRYGGTGLGLAISKSLAELMGGEVGVRSLPGQGSTFWFTVPVQRGAPARPLLPAPDLRGLRVLVVDDNAHAATVIAEMLQSMSFEVEQAHSGAEALRALQRATPQGQAFDLVVLDWQMPGMDGLELARRIGELRLPRLPRRVMVTGFGREDVLGSARRQGIEEVLIKPVSASVMFDTLMAVLGDHGELATDSVAAAPLSPACGSPQFAALRGARVLVVEDNELNQQVAREMLEEVGVVVEVASNGEEGVAMASARPFDLVLMDMQMPVMDGLEATRELRAEPRLSALPVIAMTANALEADRQRCLDAGMNDHLAKPMAAESLWKTLQRWLAPAARGAVDTPATADRPGAGAALDDTVLPAVPGLNLAQGLRSTMGRRALYAETLRRFLGSQEHAPVRIGEALAAGHGEIALREAHTLRGLAGMVGATAVQDSAERLEEALRNGPQDDEAVRPLLEALKANVDQLLQSLQPWCGRVQGPAGGALPGAAAASLATGGSARQDPASREAINTALQQLHELLQRDDPAAVVFVQRHAALLQQALGSALPALQAHLEQFDYENALRLLDGQRVALAQAPGYPPRHRRKGSSHAT